MPWMLLKRRSKALWSWPYLKLIGKDIAVPFDGSWNQLGFTAVYCSWSVISIATGKVVDYHVASKVYN